MKNFLSIFQAACILKRCLFTVVLLINVAYGATDLSRAENYFPGGKYRLFNYPDRGSVTNVVNNIHKRVLNDEAIGPIHYQHVFYNGTLTYDRRFSGHPWWDHDYGPLGATTQEIHPFNGGIGFNGGIDVIKATISGRIYHPADAYDGEQGGGLPPPSDKGARDEYTYGVTGEVHSVDVQPLNIPKKVNDIVNRVRDAYDTGAFGDTNAENRQPEDNSADNDRRRDLHSDGQPENGQPEKADNGSWEDAEVKPPVDVATAEGATDAGGWLSDLLGSLAKKRNPYKSSIEQLEDSADYNPMARDLMDDIGRFGDDAGDAARKGGKAGAGSKATDLSKTKIETGKQNKHIEGTNEYNTELANGRTNKSLLTTDPNSLTSQFGTGKQVGNIPVGQPGSKEVIDFGKNIGYHVDKDTGVRTLTTEGTVHYSKKGAHVVPNYPSSKNGS